MFYLDPFGMLPRSHRKGPERWQIYTRLQFRKVGLLLIV